MDVHAADVVAVVPATVLPPGVRYSTLSTEAHEQNHLAVGYDEQRYLAVHPGYSLSPRVYALRLLAAVAMVLIEVIAFLLVLLGLCTPCYAMENFFYSAIIGGYAGDLADSPQRSTSLIICSILVIIFLFLFSCICPVVIAVCVPLDQHARVSEESFNRELLERRGAQVHADGRVFSADGVPSAWKQEGMLGPCCGFEANERSRLSRNTGIYGVHWGVELIGLVLQSVVLYNIAWVYNTAKVQGGKVRYASGYYLTVVALVLRILVFLWYGFSAFRVLCISPHRRMPPCQLMPLGGRGQAAGLATAAAAEPFASKEGDRDAYPSKPASRGSAGRGGNGVSSGAVEESEMTSWNARELRPVTRDPYDVPN